MVHRAVGTRKEGQREVVVGAVLSLRLAGSVVVGPAAVLLEVGMGECVREKARGCGGEVRGRWRRRWKKGGGGEEVGGRRWRWEVRVGG